MKIILVFLLVALTIQNYGQSVPAAELFSIDKKELKQTIKVLASDSMEGRLTGTLGQMKAARYIAGQFRTNGLTGNGNNGFYDDFKLLQVYRGETYLKTGDRRLNDFEEMVYMGHEPQNEEQESELIFGGRGTPEELDQIDVKNRMVLVFAKNVRSSFFVNEELKRRGANGVILANPDNVLQFESVRKTLKNFMTRKRYMFADGERQRMDTSHVFREFIIPNNQIGNVMGVSLKELNQLVEAKDIDHCQVTTIRLKCERIENRTTGRNVIGVLKGRSDTAIYITAHYDHLGTDGHFYFHGADDNASGVASMLELAKIFSGWPEMKYTMVFLATTGEEVGELGVRYQVNRNDFEPAKVLVNMNIDMIGRVDEQHIGKADYLYSIGTDAQPKLAALFEKADQQVPQCSFDYTFNNSHDLTGYYMRSDQYHFYKKGIPAVMFFAGMHKDYHKPTDTPEKINSTLLQNRVHLISQVILLLQQQGKRN